MTKTRRIIAGAALGSLLVLSTAACGGSKKEQASETTVSTVPGQRSPEDQKIMDELADKINVPEGERIEPGSIPSTKVDGLSQECAQAIQPIRDLMEKYKSGLLVPPDDQTIGSALGAANPDEGGVCTYQEFADFYADEFNGWNNAVAQ